MGGATNKKWNLKDWAQAQNNWGYAPKLGEQCGENKSVRFCYNELIKPPKERTLNVDPWVNKDLLTQTPLVWGQVFDPNQQTCIKQDRTRELPWGEVLDRIINQIQTDLLAQPEPKGKELLWNSQEWYSLLEKAGNLTTPWDKTESGQRLLIVIVCIITGLTSSRTGSEVKYEGRSTLCHKVDDALSFTQQQWKDWVTSFGKDRRTRGVSCNESSRYRECHSTGMSLILTVYRSLSSLCPKCGPYAIGKWINKFIAAEVTKGELSCKVTQRKITCDKYHKGTGNVADLWINDINKIPLDSISGLEEFHEPTPEHPVKGADIVTTPEQKKEKLIALTTDYSSFRPTTPPTRGNEEQSGRTQNALTQYSSVKQSQAKDSRSYVPTAGVPSPPGAGMSTKSREVLTITDNGKGSSRTRQEDAEEDPPSQGETWDTGGSKQGSPVQTKSDTSDQSIYATVGGVLGVLLLAMASAYGIFRICKRKKDSNSRRQKSPRMGQISYSMKTH
ncbi:hypothetical protein C922_05692 [Plasmodium inui San Antonio 1]|uniref:Uncharacterized protein n=1 Tax=Plasmodium inui San Antonio 1 TaxID=1237626 RepID=W7A4A8_9APIC|nr:hypothetical protein C922_05692 [Plasmodium inui San Antonio 1]EUD63929.1 hypothetical protein C922_05692 [Plasmodium inui San Antonio 1]